MPDPIKWPTRGPKMLWVFKSRIAESVETRVFIDFDAMPSEPSMSREELDEEAYSWTAKLEDSRP